MSVSVTLREHAIPAFRGVLAKSLTGRVTLADVALTDTVGAMKQAICRVECIPPEQQRLQYGSQILENGAW